MQFAIRRCWPDMCNSEKKSIIAPWAWRSANSRETSTHEPDQRCFKASQGRTTEKPVECARTAIPPAGTRARAKAGRGNDGAGDYCARRDWRIVFRLDEST